MAKIFKIQGYLVDYNDRFDARDIADILEEMPDIIAHHIKVEEHDIGEWEDDNPLNYHKCPESECEKYFKAGE